MKKFLGAVLLTVLLGGCASESAPVEPSPSATRDEATTITEYQTQLWSELLPLDEYPEAVIGSDYSEPQLSILEQRCGEGGEGLWWRTYTSQTFPEQEIRERAVAILEKDGFTVQEEEPGATEDGVTVTWSYHGIKDDPQEPIIFISYFTPETEGTVPVLAITTWGSCVS